MKKTITLSLVFMSAFFFFSFHQKLDRKTKNALNEGYAFIPAGKLTLEGKETTIQSFIMFQGEVTNFQYQEFLGYLKETGQNEKWEIAKVDSTLWLEVGSFNDRYRNYYFRHPAYAHYPVVNISKEAAELYCQWLTEQFLPNKMGDSKLIFRLPSKEEWIYAANAGKNNATYSWGTSALRNKEGGILCNFAQFGSENITRDSLGNYSVVKKASPEVAGDLPNDVTAPTKSYWPNGFGLYNMNGNVAEMLAGTNVVIGGSWRDPGYDVRNQSEKIYKGAAANIGFRVIATATTSELSWLKNK